MRLFKRDYVRRKVKKNDDDWKEIIEAEMDKVDEKERVLSELSYAQIRREQLGVKVISHQIACSYLGNLLDNSVNNLYIRGLYQNDQEINSMDNYWEWMLSLITAELHEDNQIYSNVRKIFPETVPSLKKLRGKADATNMKIQRRYTRVAEYKVAREKEFYFYWINEVDNCPLYFSVFHEMILDNSIGQYDSDMMGRYGELEERYNGGQLNTEEYQESLKNDFPDQGKSTFRMG